MDLYHQISFKTSELITKSYSTSFSIAVSFLSREMRRAIYSIYGFVRLADEIVDSFDQVNKKMLLQSFERDYHKAMLNGVSTNLVLHAFTLTVKKYNIPQYHIESFLKSMKADLTKKRYNNKNELKEYIYGSADVVGLMCLRVFVNGDKQLYNRLEKPAMKLGSAFQKVNFLRDLKADTEGLKRHYFPRYEADNFDETMKSLLIKDIEKDFKAAKEGLKALPGKSKLAVLIALIYYKHLLKKLKKTPAKKIISTRIRLAGIIKLLLLGKAYLKFQLNII